MEMAKVKSCNVSECSYNSGQMCHALAITIGDMDNPACDTFCQSSMKGGDMEATAGVGACKVAACTHNQTLECNCSSIDVGYNNDQVKCLSFESS